MSRRIQFETIRSEGALLPPDLLQRLVEQDRDLGGLRGEDYGLPPNEPLSEAIVRSYNRMIGAWGSFQEARTKLPDGDPGTSITRDRLLLVLLQELGYGRVQTEHAIEIDGRAYPISHAWEKVPIHLLGCNVPLGVRTKGVAGASSQSPHGTLQELLNRSEERLWGIVSNGLELRLLRDNSSLTRQAFVSFDLEQMFDGDIYADFALLWMLCHASRVEGERPHECWLERWSQEAERQGTRALEGLRSGVEEAISALGSGFLRPGRNAELKAALRAGELSTQDYYRELLRLVYRVLFLFVAEDRKLLHHPEASEQAKERYAEWYSTTRLRRLAERRRGTKHGDLWEGLLLVMRSLGKDGGEPALGLPPLGSFLWSHDAIAQLERARLPNRALLDAVRSLATVKDGKVLRSVDYKNLGAEELGSVYESLLELHPELDLDAGTFSLTTAPGNERKTTGSYYTPSSLISSLLDSALDPVLDEAAAKGEDAILDLKVVDPACGSGHFLVAAAHRIAKRLATVRIGDAEPSPEATRTALRDVIGRCVCGVDMNPMAVELCKVSLWMEALDPGRPLSFLDAHIKCGNSLLGTTVELIDEGIPDVAFKTTDGDDKEIAKSLRAQNKTEREGQLTLDDAAGTLVHQLEAVAMALEATADDSMAEIREKERSFAALTESETYDRAKLTADAWCSAFIIRKVESAPRITTGVIRRLAGSGGHVPETVHVEVAKIASEYGLFHWEIEFPQVFGRDTRGFDLVIGNPPWDQVQFREQEFFAPTRPDIADAPTAAKRKASIDALAVTDPVLFKRYQSASRRTEATRNFVTRSGRFPHTGGGRVNLFGLFAENAGRIIGRTGAAGLVLPTGIATDDTSKEYFESLVASRQLVTLFDFENRDLIFPDIDSRTRFCLLTFAGRARVQAPTFVFLARSTAELETPDRQISLSYDDIRLVNPSTKTSPIFVNRREARIVLDIYRSVGPFVDLWPYHTKPGLFNMAGDSSIFRSAEASDDSYVPLYEGKMVGFFDHRAADVIISPTARLRQGQPREVSLEEHMDPGRRAQARYFVPATDVEERLHGEWPRPWLLGWKEVTSPTNERTLIPCILPRVGVGHKIHLVILSEETARLGLALLACLSTFVLDFVCRRKLSGTSLTPFVVKQLPVLGPGALTEERCAWDTGTAAEWVRDRVLELCYTAWDMKAVAADFGHNGDPFRWDVDRRELLRAELDAAFFHLYGLAEEDVDYVMETFSIVRRRDEESHGHYRTKALILDVYRKMADAAASGVPYETILDPSPADLGLQRPPSMDHPARQAMETT